VGAEAVGLKALGWNGQPAPGCFLLTRPAPKQPHSSPPRPPLQRPHPFCFCSECVSDRPRCCSRPARRLGCRRRSLPRPTGAGQDSAPLAMARNREAQPPVCRGVRPCDQSLLPLVHQRPCRAPSPAGLSRPAGADPQLACFCPARPRVRAKWRATVDNAYMAEGRSESLLHLVSIGA